MKQLIFDDDLVWEGQYNISQNTKRSSIEQHALIESGKYAAKRRESFEADFNADHTKLVVIGDNGQFVTDV